MKFIDDLVKLQKDYNKIEWLGTCKIYIRIGSSIRVEDTKGLKAVNATLFKIPYSNLIFAVHKQYKSEARIYNVSVIDRGMSTGTLGHWSVEEAVLMLLYNYKKRKRYKKNMETVNNDMLIKLHPETIKLINND